MAIVEAIREAAANIKSWIISHLRAIASFSQLLAAYGVLYLSQTIKPLRNEIWAVIIALPILVSIFAAYCRWYANRVGKGITVPVPAKRFTEVDQEDGMVTIEHSRLQELLLYMADLEDWLERMGLL